MKKYGVLEKKNMRDYSERRRTVRKSKRGDEILTINKAYFKEIWDRKEEDGQKVGHFGYYILDMVLLSNRSNFLSFSFKWISWNPCSPI